MRLSQQVAELDSKLMLTHAYFVYAVDAEGELDSEKLGALLQPGTSPLPRGDALSRTECCCCRAALWYDFSMVKQGNKYCAELRF
jgi:hypothetical protein